MKFEWDAKKADANLQKHGVSFDEAASVFLDPLAASGPDPFALLQSTTPTDPVPFEFSAHGA